MEVLSRVLGAPTRPLAEAGDRLEPRGSRPGSALEDPEAIERARRRNPNAFKPWSGEEDRRLREGARAGKSPEDLAAQLQRSPRAVTMRLEKLGERPAT